MKTRRLKLFLYFGTFITGIAIGMLSQRIPEIKTYTDEITQPLENSDFFKQIKINWGYRDEVVNIHSPSSNPQSYVQQNPLPRHPISLFIIHRPEYSVAYDARNRNPAWIYEHLTTKNTKKNVEGPSVIDFKEDNQIPPHLRTTLADYQSKGLNKGQMAAVLNHRSTQEAFNDTFYLTNICPQCPQLNHTYWFAIEQQIRDLTNDYQNVYVITGPLYLPYQDQGSRFVKYRVMGPNDVAIPSHFFKVLTLEDKQGKMEKRAYILPNHEIARYTPLDQFKTTIEKVEKAAGMIFP